MFLKTICLLFTTLTAAQITPTVTIRCPLGQSCPPVPCSTAAHRTAIIETLVSCAGDCASLQTATAVVCPPGGCGDDSVDRVIPSGTPIPLPSEICPPGGCVPEPEECTGADCLGAPRLPATSIAFTPVPAPARTDAPLCGPGGCSGGSNSTAVITTPGETGGDEVAPPRETGDVIAGAARTYIWSGAGMLMAMGVVALL